MGIAIGAERQQRRVYIPLNNPAAIAQHMPAQRQRFLRTGLGAVIVLRHFQHPGIQFNHLAASTFSLAFQAGHDLKTWQVADHSAWNSTLFGYGHLTTGQVTLQ